MLRSRFHQHSNTGTWEQLVVPAETNAFSVEEHVYHDEQSFQDTVQSRQAVLNLQHGPLFVADLFSKEGEEQSLLLSAHHIIIDLVSWRIIWHDISKSLGTGGRMTPPAVSFQTWCRVQEEEGRTLVPDQVLPYNVEAAQMEYWGLETGDNRFSDSDTHEHILDAKSTALLLGSSNDSLRTETLDILIGAMAYSFRKVFADRSAPAIFLEGHGREPVAGVDTDIAETVGWFTTLCPVPISGNSTDSLVDTIRVAKDTRARVPGKGRPYIACRYHSTAGREAFNNHRDVEILLNYRGVFQQLENSGSLLQREDRPGRSVTIQEFGSEYQRMALVEINIVVEAGRARISTMTHKRMRHQDRLQHWLTLFPETLQAAADDLLVPSHRPTLADMPLLSISYVSLDALLTEQLTTRGVALSAIRDIYPCTPIQEGILLSSKRGVASYRNSWVWRCSSSKGSPISFQGLVAAWKTTARRHSVFSTIFASHPDTGRYIQVLLRDSDPRCVCISVETSKSATQYLLDMESPATGSASQAEYLITVCQGRGQEVACRLDMSHALIDASSIPVLLRDLASHYAGQGEDRREPPPFSEIVSHIEQINPTSSRVAYWQAHLAGAWKCELLGDLPVHIRQADSGYHYGVIPLATTQNTTIATWCREQNATRAVFLQVAWALVLALFTGITESCFGYVCSGRDTPIDQIEAVVGPLISMLVARIDLSPPQLESVLTAVGEQSIEHLSHQHTLLAEIQHALGSGPLFNTAITVREAHQYGNEDGLRLEEMREEDPDEYDVLLSAILDGDETEISIQYRSDFMSTGFAQNIARALHFAIAYLSRSPSAFYTSRVSEIETISNQDLDEIWAWNTAVPEPVNSLVHDLFAQTVARHPEAPAISVWNGELTYQALDHLSTQLALYLVHLGVEPCGVVPIYIEKSLWTPVAQLAVMKSGGASVLLDSTQPTERARAIMQQVKPDVLIASPALEALASTLGAPDLIVLDWSLFEKIQQIVCGRSLLSKSVPSDVLYIVFTSGSTGTPKGAMISHGNFAAAIHHQQRALEYTGPGLRVYDFVSYAFDVAWSNALHSLTSGACLCIPSDAQRKDDLIGSLQGSKAALVDLTPSVLRLLKPRDLTHLRQVLLSGESFTKADLGDWVKHPGLLNTYGPAECSVKATMAPVNPVSTYENNIG
ncbi:hypothetical protein EJ07DRAFT_108785 [Lizonia empirigonia]|nr:hypothetical protein EJ07DRAFT_108785 [Lizonia empirigonia]